VYAFCVGALGSAAVIAAKIPSVSYAMGAEGEEIHPPHRHNYTHVHTHHTPHMNPTHGSPLTWDNEVVRQARTPKQ